MTKIMEYFTVQDKEHWLSEIQKSDWGAGQFLYELLKDGKLKDTVGETAQVLMLTEGKELLAFCTLAPLDDIQPTERTPWIGFVYTYPQYRGNHYAGLLLDHAEKLAAAMKFAYSYISTEHIGLYEKYGYEFYRMGKDINGEESRIYRKALT